MSHSKVASRATVGVSLCACATATHARLPISANAATTSRSRRRSLTGGPLGVQRDEAEHVGEGEDEAARAGVGSKTEISRQIHGQAREARVAARRIGDGALAGQAVDAEAREEIDAVDGALAAIERDAILARDLERVGAVA